MNLKSRLAVILSLLLLAGCASGPTIQSPEAPVAYTPMASPTRIPGSATIAASYEPGPEMQQTWRRMGFNDAVIQRHRQEVARALVDDLAASGLFARVLPAAANVRPDHVVRIQCVTATATGSTSIQASLECISGATGKQEWALSTSTVLGPVQGPHRPLAEVLPEVMAHLRANLASGLAMKAREEAELAEIAGLKTASLADLLVASDRNTTLARERNRAIIAAKNQQLPAILRDSKAAELSALVVKIEQTILALNHESEVAKDRAQQATATNGDARQIEELRGLTISYRERIELLKPILTALKEEIANRGR